MEYKKKLLADNPNTRHFQQLCRYASIFNGFASWKQVLMDAMQNATLQDFMKGVQSAICAMTGDPVNANTGNPVKLKEPDGSIISYTYDSRGSPILFYKRLF